MWGARFTGAARGRGHGRVPWCRSSVAIRDHAYRGGDLRELVGTGGRSARSPRRGGFDGLGHRYRAQPRDRAEPTARRAELLESSTEPLTVAYRSAAPTLTPSPCADVPRSRGDAGRDPSTSGSRDTIAT